jgi:two-component system, sensor histidine kinase and response regulator
MKDKNDNGRWFFVLDERARILFVDDDLILAEFAKVHLATPVAEVESDANGQAAWERLCGESFDLVLVDIEMPVLDGFGLLERIRADARFEHLPVIMLTGREDIASIDRAYRLGATSFVTKPVNWRQLSYNLRYVLRTSRMEAEIRRERDRAEELSQLKSNVLSLIKHEVRTPLNSIIGFSDIIRQQTDGPISIKSYLTYAEQIGAAAHHLHDKFMDMIQYAQLSSGDATLTDDEYRVNKIIEAAVAAVLPRAARASIATENGRLPGTLYVRCDRDRLVRALSHLLENALIHGGNNPIDLTVDRSPIGDLIFSITDQGPGIPADQLAGSMQPLGTKTSLDRLRQGLGLGLPLARRIAELHGGKLEVKTRGDTGTTVEIVLPACRVVEPQPLPAPVAAVSTDCTIAVRPTAEGSI